MKLIEQTPLRPEQAETEKRAGNAMEQHVMISIRGEQEICGADKNVTEFVTGGLLTATDYGYLLEYDESELTGMEGTHTAFQIRPDSVALIRTGAFRSQMIFERLRKHYSLYDTPYGTMTMGITTTSLHSAITGDGGELDVRYAIEIEHQVTGECRFLIQVRPSGAQ